MTESDPRCDLCDLPLSQCVHGRPPPVPTAAAPAPPKPRKRAAAAARTPATVPARAAANRRFTPPEILKPLILAALREAGGELDAEDLYLELEILAEDELRPGDREKTPAGEVRWQYAARRARLALIEEGLMVKGKPGVWQLA